jgi:hypothetical protein
METIKVTLPWIKTTANKVKYELNQGAGPEGLIISAYLPRSAFGPATMYPVEVQVTVELPGGTDA